MPGAALQGYLPQNNAVQNFNASQAQALQEQQAGLEMKKQGLQGLYMMSAGMLRDGEVNPDEWEQGLDWMEQQGTDPKAIAQLRGKPHMAEVLAKGSAEALRYSLDAQQFDFALKKFEQELEAAATAPAKPPQVETRFNPETGRQEKVQWDGQQWVPFGGQEAPSSPSTVVNVGPNGEQFGDPGKGRVWQRGSDGKIMLDERGAPIAIPFQGGEVWQAEQDAAAAGAAETASNTIKTDIVTEDVGRALELIKKDPFWTTGLVGGWLSQIGGTQAKNLKELIAPIRANAGFAELQAMREASPTGGALGQVTEKELAFLQSVLGSLDQEQDDEQLAYNLKRVATAFMDIIHGPGNWDKNSIGGGQSFTTPGGIEYSF